MFQGLSFPDPSDMEQKRRWKDCKNQKGWRMLRKQILDTAGLMHLGTHRDCSRLHRSKIDRVPALGEEVDTSSIPNPGAAFN